MERQAAMALLRRHVKSENLIKHALAVEAAMRSYAVKFGEDREYWGVLGLLHDIDFEEHPDLHPLRGVEMLEKEGFSPEFLLAVKGHADTQAERTTLLAKTLYAVDELASFIVACALVRPDRDFSLIKVSSVKKKLKDKAFARGVNRDTVYEGAKELGVSLEEHIDCLILGLAQRQSELQAEGLGLI